MGLVPELLQLLVMVRVEFVVLQNVVQCLEVGLGEGHMGLGASHNGAGGSALAFAQRGQKSGQLFNVATIWSHRARPDDSARGAHAALVAGRACGQVAEWLRIIVGAVFGQDCCRVAVVMVVDVVFRIGINGAQRPCWCNKILVLLLLVVVVYVVAQVVLVVNWQLLLLLLLLEMIIPPAAGLVDFLKGLHAGRRGGRAAGVAATSGALAHASLVADLAARRRARGKAGAAGLLEGAWQGGARVAGAKVGRGQDGLADALDLLDTIAHCVIVCINQFCPTISRFFSSFFLSFFLSSQINQPFSPLGRPVNGQRRRRRRQCRTSLFAMLFLPPLLANGPSGGGGNVCVCVCARAICYAFEFGATFA